MKDVGSSEKVVKHSVIRRLLWQEARGRQDYHFELGDYIRTLLGANVFPIWSWSDQKRGLVPLPTGCFGEGAIAHNILEAPVHGLFCNMR